MWDKGNSRPQKGRFRQQAEYIVWGSNGDMPISRPVPCLPGVFKYGNPQNRIHLTEKPLPLMRDVVKITEPGGHILDPFAGSGTTILAAVLEGYTATGIEVTGGMPDGPGSGLSRSCARRREHGRQRSLSFLCGGVRDTFGGSTTSPAVMQSCRTEERTISHVSSEA